jgi:hypothetical protein
LPRKSERTAIFDYPAIANTSNVFHSVAGTHAADFDIRLPRRNREKRLNYRAISPCPASLATASLAVKPA